MYVHEISHQTKAQYQIFKKFEWMKRDITDTDKVYET